MAAVTRSPRDEVSRSVHVTGGFVAACALLLFGSNAAMFTMSGWVTVFGGFAALAAAWWWGRRLVSALPSEATKEETKPVARKILVAYLGAQVVLWASVLGPLFSAALSALI